MDYVSLIKADPPSRVSKQFRLDASGKLEKTAVAQLVEGRGKTVVIETAEKMVRLLKIFSEKDDIVLLPGLFEGAEVGAQFQIVTEKRLAKLLGVERKDVPGGVQVIDGDLYAARLKRGINPSSWILFDADSPLGMPAAQVAWGIQQRLEYLEPVVPGISTCCRVEARSSSARVHKKGDLPGVATHAFVQVSEPGKIDVLREHLKLETQLQGLSFDSPRYSRKTGELIGNDARSVLDWSVLVSGRLVFTARPVVDAPGYCVADADVRILNPDGGVLDLSGISLPAPARLEELREMTGRVVTFSRGGSLSIADTGTLKLNTPIEIKGVERPLQELLMDMQSGDKIRCETPFRDSNSEAAFIRIGDDGDPFLHDVGTSTNYLLSVADALKLSTDRRQFNNLDPANGQSAPVPATLPIQPVATSDKLPFLSLLDDPYSITRRPGGKAPVANVANAMVVLEQSEEWDGVFAYNEMTDETTLVRPLPGVRTPRASFKPRLVEDTDMTRTQTWFQRHKFVSMGRQPVIDAIHATASENVISPVRHMLEDIERAINWTPTTHEPKIMHLCTDYFGAGKDRQLTKANRLYLIEVSRRFMVSAVARALQPGCKVDTMLVLEGGQGPGKSTALKILAGEEWFSDSLPSIGTKDASDHLRGKWIIEIPELSAMTKADVENTKAFISRQTERYRRPYDRSETIYPRRCVFVGTTNQYAYLRDETGNRRFWPVRVGNIDLEALKRDRSELWAEAVYWYRQEKPWHMTGHLVGLAEAAQASRVVEDIWQGKLERALEGETEVALNQAADFLVFESSKLSRADQNRLIACLTALGFKPQGKFTKGEHRHARRYVRL